MVVRKFFSVACVIFVTCLALGRLGTNWELPAPGRNATLKGFASIFDTSDKDSDNSTDVPAQKIEQDWVPDREWFAQCAADVNSSENLMKPFAGSLSKYQRYRLGDCIKMCSACTTRHGNRTIAALYSQRACPKENPQFRLIGNLPIVFDIFRELEQSDEGFQKPDPDALVMHVRLGDVVEGSRTNITTMLMEGGDPRHARLYRGAIKSYFEYMNNIQESGSKKVVLVGGSHKAEMYERSRQYLHCLERAMVKSGVDVELRIDTLNPDHDFYYISNAKQLTVSTGGFSRIMGNLAEAQGGRIIGKKYEDRDPDEVFRGVGNATKF